MHNGYAIAICNMFFIVLVAVFNSIDFCVFIVFYLGHSQCYSMFLQPDLHILLLPFCNFTVFYCHVWEQIIGFCWLRSTRVTGVEEEKAEENEKKCNG